MNYSLFPPHSMSHIRNATTNTISYQFELKRLTSINDTNEESRIQSALFIVIRNQKMRLRGRVSMLFE